MRVGREILRRIRQLSTNADGNTGLHIACIHNNYDLVFLLFYLDAEKNVCSPTVLNKQGLNAYQCAHSDQVRMLFTHSTSLENRFVDINSNSNSIYTRLTFNITCDQPDLAAPHDWHLGCTSKENTTDTQLVLAMSQASWIVRKLFKLRTESGICEAVRNLIRCCTNDNTTYEKLMKPFNCFIRTKNAKHLLTLYTIESPLYSALREENNAFTTLLFLYLETIADFTYEKGGTFRGMVFTNPLEYQTALDGYRWAEKNPDRVLETRAFQSSSIERIVAGFFISARRPENQPSFAILCIYNFPRKCSTAFDLRKLSAYDGEAEILISPYTLFHVTNIERQSSDYHIISLTNESAPETSLFKSWKKAKK